MTVTIVGALFSILAVVIPLIAAALVKRSKERSAKNDALVKQNLVGVDSIVDKLRADQGLPPLPRE